MKTYHSKQDIHRIIGDTPIDESLYVEGWIEIVADNFLDLLISKGFEYGRDLNEIEDYTEENFWECFRDAEKPVTSE